MEGDSPIKLPPVRRNSFFRRDRWIDREIEVQTISRRHQNKQQSLTGNKEHLAGKFGNSDWLDIMEGEQIWARRKNCDWRGIELEFRGGTTRQKI